MAGGLDAAIQQLQQALHAREAAVQGREEAQGRFCSSLRGLRAQLAGLGAPPQAPPAPGEAPASEYAEALVAAIGGQVQHLVAQQQASAAEQAQQRSDLAAESQRLSQAQAGLDCRLMEAQSLAAFVRHDPAVLDRYIAWLEQRLLAAGNGEGGSRPAPQEAGSAGQGAGEGRKGRGEAGSGAAAAPDGSPKRPAAHKAPAAGGAGGHSAAAAGAAAPGWASEQQAGSSKRPRMAAQAPAGSEEGAAEPGPGLPPEHPPQAPAPDMPQQQQPPPPAVGPAEGPSARPLQAPPPAAAPPLPTWPPAGVAEAGAAPGQRQPVGPWPRQHHGGETPDMGQAAHLPRQAQQQQQQVRAEQPVQPVQPVGGMPPRRWVPHAPAQRRRPSSDAGADKEQSGAAGARPQPDLLPGAAAQQPREPAGLGGVLCGRGAATAATGGRGGRGWRTGWRRPGAEQAGEDDGGLSAEVERLRSQAATGAGGQPPPPG